MVALAAVARGTTHTRGLLHAWRERAGHVHGRQVYAPCRCAKGPVFLRKKGLACWCWVARVGLAGLEAAARLGLSLGACCSAWMRLGLEIGTRFGPYHGLELGSPNIQNNDIYKK